MNYIEGVGYLASVLIAVSLTMTSIKKLRVINLIGSALFAIYGLIITAYPVFAVNTFIALTNIFYLSRLQKDESLFEYKEISTTNGEYLNKFIALYEKDIHKYFPNFSLTELKNPRLVFTIRNLIFVGLFIWEPVDDETISIKLDYVIPEYRDSKNARFLFSHYGKELREKGYKFYSAEAAVKAHRTYLKRQGFKETETVNIYSRAI